MTWRFWALIWGIFKPRRSHWDLHEEPGSMASGLTRISFIKVSLQTSAMGSFSDADPMFMASPQSVPGNPGPLSSFQGTGSSCVTLCPFVLQPDGSLPFLKRMHTHSPKRCKEGPWKLELLTTGGVALQKWGLLKAFSATQNPAVLH